MILELCNGEMMHDAPLLCQYLMHHFNDTVNIPIVTRILARYSHEMTLEEIKKLNCPFMTGLNRKVEEARNLLEEGKYEEVFDLLDEDVISSVLYENPYYEVYSFFDDAQYHFYANYMLSKDPDVKVLNTVECYSEAYFTMALAAYRMEDEQLAQFHLENALKWNPLHTEARRLMAVIYMNDRKLKKAEDILKEALDFEVEGNYIANIYLNLAFVAEERKKIHLAFACALMASQFNGENEAITDYLEYIEDNYNISGFKIDRIKPLFDKAGIPVGPLPEMSDAVFKSCLYFEEKNPDVAEFYYHQLLQFGTSAQIERRLAVLAGEDQIDSTVAKLLEDGLILKKRGDNPVVYQQILEGSFYIPLKNTVPENLIVELQDCLSAADEDFYMDDFRKYLNMIDMNHHKVVPLYTRKEKVNEEVKGSPFLLVRFDSLMYLVAHLDIDLVINPQDESEYYLDRLEFNRVNDVLMGQLGPATLALMKCKAEPTEENIEAALNELLKCDFLLPYNDVEGIVDNPDDLIERLYVVNTEEEMALGICTIEECLDMSGNVELYHADMEEVLEIFDKMEDVYTIVINSGSNAEMILDYELIDILREKVDKDHTSVFLS